MGTTQLNGWTYFKTFIAKDLRPNQVGDPEPGQDEQATLETWNTWAQDAYQSAGEAQRQLWKLAAEAYNETCARNNAHHLMDPEVRLKFLESTMKRFGKDSSSLLSNQFLVAGIVLDLKTGGMVYPFGSQELLSCMKQPSDNELVNLVQSDLLLAKFVSHGTRNLIKALLLLALE